MRAAGPILQMYDNVAVIEVTGWLGLAAYEEPSVCRMLLLQDDANGQAARGCLKGLFKNREGASTNIASRKLRTACVATRVRQHGQACNILRCANTKAAAVHDRLVSGLCVCTCVCICVVA